MLTVCTMLSGNARDPAGRARRHTGHAPAVCPSSLQAAHSVMTACQGLSDMLQGCRRASGYHDRQWREGAVGICGGGQSHAHALEGRPLAPLCHSQQGDHMHLPSACMSYWHLCRLMPESYSRVCGAPVGSG